MLAAKDCAGNSIVRSRRARIALPKTRCSTRVWYYLPTATAPPPSPCCATSPASPRATGGCSSARTATSRSPPAAAAAALGVLPRETTYDHIGLAGLGSTEVEELLEAVADQKVPDAFVAAITAETSGNPFFIRELLLHLVRQFPLRRRRPRGVARGITVGGQNWVWADVNGDIAYFPYVLLPQRPPRAPERRRGRRHMCMQTSGWSTRPCPMPGAS